MRERFTGTYSWSHIIYNYDFIEEKEDGLIVTYIYHGICSEDYAKRLSESVKNFLTQGRSSCDEIESIIKEAHLQGERFEIPKGFIRDIEALYNEAIYDSANVRMFGPSFEKSYGTRQIVVCLHDAKVLSPECHLNESENDD